jgi:hypothetical protein
LAIFQRRIEGHDRLVILPTSGLSLAMPTRSPTAIRGKTPKRNSVETTIMPL